MLAPPHTVLKTSSGKIRRAACRQLFEQGQLGRGERRVWVQLLRLGASGLGPGLSRLGGRLGAGLWAGYAWFWFLLLAPVAWIGVHLLPRPAWRWSLIHRLARLLLGLLRLPLDVETDAPLAPGPLVLVANHASYLDGLLLVAALPEPLAFVAKAEFVGSFIAGRFLRRIGAEFVERFDPARGLEDVHELEVRLAAGKRLAIFPEGTFGRAPGLLPFRMGAFSLAVEAGAAVQPLVIQGSRSLLRGDSRFPRREPIRIRLLAPILPQGEGWSGALKLRDAPRAAMLSQSGEPDLGD
jgi:1-acyl-sn-glycerol-3-phosphate acyltransferase